MTDLTVADVRLALHALRHAWYEDCGPDRPFLFSAVALEADGGPASAARPAGSAPGAAKGPPGRTLTMAEFGCVFDYAQHIKRHQRLAPRGAGAGGIPPPK